MLKVLNGAGPGHFFLRHGGRFATSSLHLLPDREWLDTELTLICSVLVLVLPGAYTHCFFPSVPFVLSQCLKVQHQFTLCYPKFSLYPTLHPLTPSTEILSSDFALFGNSGAAFGARFLKSPHRLIHHRTEMLRANKTFGRIGCISLDL